MLTTPAVASSPGRLKKVAFSCIAVFLFFFLCELCLRLADFKYQAFPSAIVGNQIDLEQEGMKRDPDLSWSWIPIANATRTISIPRLRYQFVIHFNSNGYRGVALAEHRVKGVNRILTMGDSCTMGWGVGDEKTYSFRLEQILRKKLHHPVEVMNAGVFGYTSFQGLHEFENHTQTYHPDVLILCYNWNDHLPALGLGTDEDGAEQPTPDKFLPKYSFPTKVVSVLSASRVTGLLEFLLGRIGVFRAINQHHRTGEAQDSGIVVRVALHDFADNLKQFLVEARAENIVPVLMTEPSAPVVNIPLKQADLKKYYLLQDAYNQAIRDTASQESAVLIDLASAFKNVDSDLFLDLVHPDSKGHGLIAQEMAPVIASLLPAQ